MYGLPLQQRDVVGILDVRNASPVRLLERVGVRKVETRSAMVLGEPCEEYIYAVARRDHT